MDLFRCSALFTIAVASTSPVVANAAEEQDLFSLSFEDLLNVQVDIASKTNETLSSVPSTISVFSRKQIQALGVDNAYEVMNFVPGMQSTRGDWVGAVPKDHARGVYLDSGNVLVMINGERVNESSFGKASVYLPYIPVEVIEKIEFIRGPGSALYGSNAFLGVMNIVTSKERNTLQLVLGNNGRYGATGQFNTSLSDDTSLFASFSYDQKDGESYPQGVKDPLEALYLEAGVDYKKLQLRARYNETSLDEFLNLAGYSKQNQHNSDNTFVGIKYNWINNDKLKLDSSYSFTKHNISSAGLIATFDDIPDFLVGPAWQTTDSKFETELSYQFDNQWQLAAGIEYSEAKQTEAGVRTSYYDFDSEQIIIDPAFEQQGIVSVMDFPEFSSLKFTFETLSAYGQLKIPSSDALTLFIGARYDDVKDIDSKLSPRLAGVYKINSEHTVKLQYGESFRTPVTNELFSNDDVTIGNPSLRSESIKTTELVWHYKTSELQANAVLFYNELNDFINIEPTLSDDALFTFTNSFNTQNSGIELDSTWQSSKDFSITGTYTQYFEDPINASFKRFASIISSYNLSDSWQVSLNLLWRDTVEVSSETGAHFKQSAYSLLGGSLKWQLNNNSQLMLKAENLLGKKYNAFDPRIDNGAVAGTTEELSLHYQFNF
ncbi:TonB-dependent receptor [Pseudoalteromonas sp. ACER1]|uniref:TonB-dependent receptor plug domain-containing protein n=1 Tax=unclassified Pseudoalteromonas TaxID=194690 RepID=UPI001F24EA9A|nr:TonB-dependent receptor [Pseudoalteromonas sp. PAST1]MCF2848903.1 TonB-dependent receptor [Pseudoalteromonas sp. PAST1]MCO7212370.1 TonB-dependent receptor [Pseudoalteromonas sp. ACER1]MED5513419.1 TonB-dependent receptor [Pseudomonadota bacterium]